jgi:hypothetical protein
MHHVTIYKPRSKTAPLTAPYQKNESEKKKPQTLIKISTLAPTHRTVSKKARRRYQAEYLSRVEDIPRSNVIVALRCSKGKTNDAVLRAIGEKSTVRGLEDFCQRPPFWVLMLSIVIVCDHVA